MSYLTAMLPLLQNCKHSEPVDASCAVMGLGSGTAMPERMLARQAVMSCLSFVGNGCAEAIANVVCSGWSAVFGLWSVADAHSSVCVVLLQSWCGCVAWCAAGGK